jgi:hypothetical protein
MSEALFEASGLPANGTYSMRFAAANHMQGVSHRATVFNAFGCIAPAPPLVPDVTDARAGSPT